MVQYGSRDFANFLIESFPGLYLSIVKRCSEAFYTYETRIRPLLMPTRRGGVGQANRLAYPDSLESHGSTPHLAFVAGHRARCLLSQKLHELILMMLQVKCPVCHRSVHAALR